MKKAFLLALVFCLSLSLFAGGSSDKKAATTETGEVDMSVVYKEPGGEFILTPQFVGYENAEIELSWQPNPSQSLTSPIQARVDDLSMKLEKWVKAHPNVKINIVGTTSNINDNMTKLRLSVVEGGAPDLCAVDSFMMPLFLEYARDVSDVAAEKGIDINDYFPYVKEQVMVGDDDVDFRFVQKMQRHFRIVEGGHLVSGILEQCFHDDEIVFLVVDDENVGYVTHVSVLVLPTAVEWGSLWL